MPSEPKSSDHKSSEFPQRLTLALSYADESATRSRRIVLFIQIAAVLTMAAVWQGADHNWLQLRSNAAQAGVRLLTCEPKAAYHGLAGSKNDADLLVRLSQTKSPAAMNREELEDALDCAAHPLTSDERELAVGYFEDRSLRLAETKKYASDLAQLARSRTLGVTVPVLGTTIDVNELSLIGGITFCILMSWFYFALRRQKQDVSAVFAIARDCDSSEAECGKAGRGNHKALHSAYGLLRMTQVLNVPPSEDPDDRNTHLLRSLTRLPNLILWTPVIAQFAVLVSDLQTLSVADYLNRLVNRGETALAAYLFIYILYKTVNCFVLLQETEQVWIRAWNDFAPESQRIEMPLHRASRWIKASHVKIATGILILAVVFHSIDEWRPIFWNSWHLWPGDAWTKALQSMAYHGGWVTFAMLLLLAVVLLLGLYRQKVKGVVRLAWVFTGLAFLDVLFHGIKASASGPDFTDHMEGFYSSPLLVIAVLLFLFSLRHEKAENATVPLPIEAEKAASAAGQPG